MSGKTQFWLGSLMLALAMGLLVGSFVLPRSAHGQPEVGPARSARYAILTGVRGSNPTEQTVYIVDDTNEILFVFEYDSRGSKRKYEFQTAIDLRKYANMAIKARARAGD
ncbi:MAG: hypothetical protein ACLF0G_00340 [Candidatus Brocadiia bacterium]